MDPVAITASQFAGESPQELLAGLLADVRLDHETRQRIGARLLAAQRLAREHELGWTAFGVSSLPQFCEQLINLSSAEGFQLRSAIEACERSEGLAARVGSHLISLPKAAAVASVLSIVQQQEGAEDRLLELATACTKRQTWAEASRIKEEARIAEPPITVLAHLSRRGVRDLERTRDLLTDGRGGARATQSQAIETALGFFVDRHCPERKAARWQEKERRRREREGGGERLVGLTEPQAPTDEVPSRAKRSPRRRPLARDRHQLILLHGDVCWFEGCEERGAIQLAHDQAFRFDGEATASNLAMWCLHHHREFDSGRLKVRQGSEGPIVVARTGAVVGRVRAPPTAL